MSLLHDRKKWRGSKDDLKKDDIVIIVDESKTRHEWKLGRIVEKIDSGPHVRRINVKRADGKVVLKDRTEVVKIGTSFVPTK